MKTIPKADWDKGIQDLDNRLPVVKMLGVAWDVDDDLFRFEVPFSMVGAGVRIHPSSLALLGGNAWLPGGREGSRKEKWKRKKK